MGLDWLGLVMLRVVDALMSWSLRTLLWGHGEGIV